jgi:hypothetical protein
MLAWESLVDILGSATAATLVRRAAARAAARAPSLKELTVAREHLEYRCVVPGSWRSDESGAELHVLCEELGALLRELTGSVVINRLRGVPELKTAGLFQTENET